MRRNNNIYEKTKEHEKCYWEKRATDDVAWIYDMYGNFPLAQLIQKHKADFQGAEDILEIGCGGLGVGLLWMFPRANQRIGLDVLEISEPPSNEIPLFRELVLCARRNVKYLRGSGESIPCEPNSLDLVVCNNVLDHTSNPENILCSVYLVLRKGGMFCLGVDCSSIFGYLYRKIKRRISGDETFVLHPYDFTFYGLNQKLQSLGFTIVEHSKVSFKNALFGPRNRKCWVLKKLS